MASGEIVLQRAPAGRLRIWRIARPGQLWKASDRLARWSLEDEPVIYASCTAGLAVLEALVHLERQDARRLHRPALIDVPVTDHDVMLLPSEQLPRGWQRRKPLTRRIGRTWLQEANSSALLVPSALVAGEMNVLIDARSSGWRDWSRQSVDAAFRFDSRLR